MFTEIRYFNDDNNREDSYNDDDRDCQTNEKFICGKLIQQNVFSWRMGKGKAKRS